AIWCVPMWLLVDTGSIAMFYLAVIVTGALLGPTYGPMCALFAEMFPVKVRLSGVSIGYAIGSIIGRALAPIISQILSTTINSAMSNATYSLAISLISLIGVLMVPKGIQDKDLHV